MTRKFILALILVASAIFVVNAQTLDVKIYLQQDVDLPDHIVRTDWVTVKRPADSKSPLRSALEWFFDMKMTAEEEKQNIYSISYGMKFEGVKLKNGVATIRFSETKQSNYGTMSGAIFEYGLQKTAKQFRAVKRVKICVVGETNMDAEYEETIFHRCK